MQTFSSAHRWPLMIGLSTSVATHGDTFIPKPEDGGIPLLGDLRWAGFASALRGGFADELLVVGGSEDLVWADVPEDIKANLEIDDESIPVNRAQAICIALSRDPEISMEALSWIASEGNTGGNIEAIRQHVEIFDLEPDEVCVVSSHYHLPRVSYDLREKGMGALAVVPAEAFWLIECDDRFMGCRYLAEALGGGPLAKRAAAEISGITDKIVGNYQSRSG